MKVNTKFNEPNPVAPVVIEQVFAEKPAGGRVANPDFVVKQGTAVYQEGTMFKPIKGYRLVAAVTSSDTSIRIAKGSGVAKNDIIGHGKKAVKCTNVNTTNAEYDVVTVTLGVNIPNDTVLYQAAAESADAAVPFGTPKYVVGNDVPAGEGDYAVRLINGANLRKETAPIAEEVVALLKSIELV